jgi:hypothetical protein
MLSVATAEQTTNELRLDLDAIVREGARRMLAAALEARNRQELWIVGAGTITRRPPQRR